MILCVTHVNECKKGHTYTVIFLKSREEETRVKLFNYLNEWNMFKFMANENVWTNTLSWLLLLVQ